MPARLLSLASVPGQRCTLTVPLIPQGGAGKPARPWSPGPPQWLLLALISTGLLHLFLPLARVVPRNGFWIGAALAVSGIVVANLAAVRLRNAGSGLDSVRPPSVLLTDGPFAWSRHPVYLGMLLLLAGEGVMLGTLGALLSWPVFYVVLRHRFVATEERELVATFGNAWQVYRQRVRRWF